MASVILCLGGGPSFDRDWAAWHRQFPEVRYDLAACNDAGIYLSGRFKLWATLHPEKMLAEWAPARAAVGLPMPEHVVACKGGKGGVIGKVISRGWHRPDGTFEDWNGSSGLYAPLVAVMHLRYRRAVLIGIPMTKEPNRFRNETTWADCIRYRAGWRLAKACPEFSPFVRSMSGWTAELLGRPDWAWLSSA